MITHSTTYPPIPIVLYLPILLLYAISILERDEAVQLHTEMIPRTVEFVTSMARMGGMLTVMIPRAECAWLDAVVFGRI